MVMVKSAPNVCTVVLYFDLSQKAEKQCSCAFRFKFFHFEGNCANYNQYIRI